MKLKRINTIAAVCLCSVVLLSGCSFSETVDNILGKTEKVVEDEFSSAPEKKDVMIVDPNMAKPSFSVNLEGSIQFAVGTEATPLTVEAAVSDGGTVTYQWYVNNVNSNGGGDKVAGATENTCVPETKEEGTWYYYVVATNTKDNHIAKSTSGTMEVSIVPEGNWVDENNLKKYQLFDGSFVTSAWKDIDGQRYAFVLMFSVLIISIDNFDFTSNFTAVVATLNNIGPGLNIVGPTGNFSMYSNLSKIVMIFDMLAGRLELFPMLLLINPYTWKEIKIRKIRKNKKEGHSI